MSAAIANTVHAVLRENVLTITCIGSGTTVVSHNIVGASDNFSFSDGDIVNPDALCFLSRAAPGAPGLSPVVVVCHDKQVFAAAIDPSAQCEPAASILRSVGGVARGVVAVEPAQALACVHGVRHICAVRATGTLAVVRSMLAPFDIARIAAARAPIDSASASSLMMCIAVGKGGGQSEIAGAYGGESDAQIGLEAVEGLRMPDVEGDDEDQQQQVSFADAVVACHTLQTSRPAHLQQQHQQQQQQQQDPVFLWWACWSNGLVTVCPLTRRGAKVRALAPMRVVPELTIPPYIVAGASISASHTTGHIAIWSSQSTTMLLGSVAANSSNNFEVSVRNTATVELSGQAASVRPIRGGAYLLAVGIQSGTKLPWSTPVPIRELMSAVDLSSNGIGNSNNASASPLNIARSILTSGSHHLNKLSQSAEEALANAEARLADESSSLSSAQLDTLERDLIQLRACRFALTERQQMEVFANDDASGGGDNNNHSNTRVAAWDRRLHVAFVMLHVTRLLRQAADAPVPASSTFRPVAEMRSGREKARTAFVRNVATERLRIPREHDEFAAWVAMWPARLIVELATEQVGLESLSALFASPAAALRPLVEKGMDAIDGCVEWIAFFALYLAGANAGESNCAAFVSALHVPPVLVTLANVARAVDGAFAAPSEDQEQQQQQAVSPATAAALANQTCLPVRRLIASLFSGLCDSGNFNAAYCMSSTLTLSHLLRGDASSPSNDNSVIDHDVALRLAFLAAERRNEPVLSVLLHGAVSVPPTQRGPDGQALVLYVVAAAARVAAETNSLSVFEGHLSDVADQDLVLQLLASFDRPKLRIELLVQAQRYADALAAAQAFVSAKPVEQHWAGIVLSHLRSVVVAPESQPAQRLGGDAAAAAAVADQQQQLRSVDNDADMLRPAPASFYTSRLQNRDASSRCRVLLGKANTICGCEVPCPYHSASQQHHN